MGFEKLEIAQRITQELHIEEKLSFETHKLTALFKLLGQLGWSIASQDPKVRERYNLYGHVQVQLKAQKTDRRTLRIYLRSGAPKYYLHENSQLVIWRNQETRSATEERPLTKREEEIYHLLLAGLSQHAIAKDLGISQRTVEKHVQNLYKKKGVKSYNELLFRED